MLERPRSYSEKHEDDEDVSAGPLREAANIRTDLKNVEESVSIVMARLERLKEQISQIDDAHSQEHFQKKIDLENAKLEHFALERSILEKELDKVAHSETDMEDELEQAHRDKESKNLLQ